MYKHYQNICVHTVFTAADYIRINVNITVYTHHVSVKHIAYNFKYVYGYTVIYC